jgi:class 3 adenylate cyclase
MRRDRTRERLHELIQIRNQDPDRSSEVDELIWKKYGKHLTILVSDQSGYTRLTRARGIIHFLSLHYRLLDMSLPIITASDGVALKTEADNILAVFVETPAAIEAAIKMNEAAAAYNKTLEPDFQIFHCIGISSGEVLRTDFDVFGDPVNVAYKLGEDVARPAEVLVCDKTHQAVADKYRFEGKQKAHVGNINLDYYRVIY